MTDERTQVSPPAASDPLARSLEWGLALILFVAPLPFGAVTPLALASLEAAAFVLLIVWLIRAFRHATPLPPLATRVGLVGLLALALLQALPTGPLAATLSPKGAEIRQSLEPGESLRLAERDLLGVDPAGFDRTASLSLDSGETGSALRTGAALAALLLVATTVAATRGVRLLALALLLAGAFQGLYGTLVLASGHDMIWNVAKQHYRDSATGTFINRNHYAGFLNAALCCGLALVLHRTTRRRGHRTSLLFDLLGPEGSRTLLLGLLGLLSLTGLVLSFSRAGIAIGLVALCLTVLASKRHRLRARLAMILLFAAAAAVPLSQMGSDRLAERYAHSVSDFAAPGGRATVWNDTLTMARAFPVVGSGFGTFATAYPLFRSSEVRLFFRHAHNDAIQFLAEGGALGGALLLLVVAAPLSRIPRALRGAEGALAAGVAAGLLALVVHSLFDFPFHIPANAAVAAALAGALSGLPWNARRSS